MPLHLVGQVADHVVAQVVEPELVVRAVGDVRGVGLAAVDRAEVDQPLVGGGIAGLEEVARVVGDHPQRDAQEVVDRAHPLRVAPGEVVVGGDDVDAAAGQRVEDRRQRGDQRLALACLHLGDLALVEDRAAQELDVEVAHPERPLHRLAGHREDVREDLVQGSPDLLVLLLATVPGEFAAALALRVVELVVRGLAGLRRLADLLAELGEAGADLVVGQTLELGLELVGPVGERLDAFDLPVVGVDKPVQEAKHGR